MKIMAIILGCLVILYTAYIVLLFILGMTKTEGIAYYGKPLSERRKFRNRLMRYRKGLNPLSNFIGPKIANMNFYGFYYENVFIPWSFCPKKNVSRAVQYQPQPEDVFIATQIRSGTTWMQQLVYEILSRGKGDLSDEGHIHLYAVSPWLEARIGVSIEKAPLIGENRKRIIKTHLPSSLCPYDEEAQYIYVARHPVSCCASSIDWLCYLGGPLMPSRDTLLDFFCSDQFLFSSWPKHVKGYWQWAQTRPNILFLHFEEMKTDLPKIILKVADFLGCKLTEGEISAITEKCSFAYMSAQAERFEMSPPTPFMSDEQGFFKSGSLKRQESFTESQRAQIMAFCSEQLADASYPISRHYPHFSTASRVS